MSKVNSFETDILELIFQNLDLANIGDATGLQGSTTAGSLYVALHTADPGEAAANQSVNECSYTGYGRVAVARSSGGWTVASDVASNTAAITFGQNTGGSQTATHVSIGTGSSGTTDILFAAALNSSLVISTNVKPEFAIGQLTITEA